MKDEQSHMDDQVDDRPPSKSQLKRDSEALQKLGEELIALKQVELEELNLPDVLNEAILTARKLNSRSGLKRQRQYIGKIMRQINSDEIRDTLTKIKHKHDINTAHFKRLELWRDKLLNNDKSVLTEIIDRYPDLDRQHVNQLVRQSERENKLGKPPASARKLFKYLRDLES